MKIEKFSQLLALVSWASVFTEGWLLILRAIPLDLPSGIPLTLFFITAILASATASTKAPKDGVK